MKRTDLLTDLRTLDSAELDARLRAVRTELFNLRFQAATGQLENHRQIRQVKRQIARVLTVQHGRVHGLEEILAPTVTGETTSARRARGRAPKATASTTPVRESTSTTKASESTEPAGEEQ